MQDLPPYPTEILEWLDRENPPFKWLIQGLFPHHSHSLSPTEAASFHEFMRLLECEKLQLGGIRYNYVDTPKKLKLKATILARGPSDLINCLSANLIASPRQDDYIVIDKWLALNSEAPDDNGESQLS